LAGHAKDPGARLLQKRLAEEVTAFVHGREELEKAIETTQKLFSGQTESAENLSIDDLEGMEGVIKSEFPLSRFETGIDIVSLLAETGIFPSKGEARKMLQGGGVSLNRKKTDNLQIQVDRSYLLHEKYLLVQKGKKHYYLVKAV